MPVCALIPNLIPFLAEKLRLSYLCWSAPDIVWRPTSRPAPGPLVVRAPRPGCDPPTHIGLSLSGLHPSLLTRQKPGRSDAEEDQYIVIIIRNIQKECIWRHCKSYVWTKNRTQYTILLNLITELHANYSQLVSLQLLKLGHDSIICGKFSITVSHSMLTSNTTLGNRDVQTQAL